MSPYFLNILCKSIPFVLDYGDITLRTGLKPFHVSYQMLKESGDLFNEKLLFIKVFKKKFPLLGRNQFQFLQTNI